MSTEGNKALAQRFIDAFAKRDVAAFREITAPALAKPAIEQWMPTQDALWADRTLKVTELMAEGDRVWVRMAYSGRQIGEWLGLPATGKTSTGTGVGFLRVSGGKVTEFVALWDDLNRLQQLGGKVVPGER
jgi:C-1 hydroxylase